MAIVLRNPKKDYLRTPKRLPLINQYPLYDLNFDGVNSIVDCGTFSPLITLTIECWVNPTVLGIQELISKGSAGADLNGDFQLRIEDAAGHIKPHLYVGGAWVLFASLGTIPAGQLSHLAMVSDGVTLSLYINGVLDANNAAVVGAWAVNAHNVYMGMYPPLPGILAYNGLIADPKIYNRNLSIAEIQHNIYNPLAPIRNSLILWFPMIEGQGATVVDSSGAGNNGTFLGGTTWGNLMKYEIPAGAGL